MSSVLGEEQKPSRIKIISRNDVGVSRCHSGGGALPARPPADPEPRAVPIPIPPCAGAAPGPGKGGQRGRRDGPLPAPPQLCSGTRGAVLRQYQIIKSEAPQRSPAMAGKKVLIVYAHQEPKSFNGSLLKIAVEELTKQGCSVTVSDLYTMQFEPRATRNDIVGHLHNSEAFNYGVETWEAYKRGGLSKDLVEEQKKVQEADLLIFQFPLFWFNMPAILKGWMDRVLVQGFAYDLSKVYDGGLLQDKLSLFSFTTGGGPEMYSKEGIGGDIRYVLWPMQHGIMHFCGVKVLEPHICYAPENVSEEKRKEMLAAWTQRLKTLWKEEPIDCSPEWYFK
ncbi:ribosyldihydronicotinamide dehydrogenase [quinone]-like isoform X1 [Motacilla alba alba]|uniref:ribosyldihydronicotinamide dehydrogenase [quinone]-like isoform X1 n=1 Tax=Motacilla alba alba TaxID=1094192 RepID=UPI0018D4FEE2|nr:ribosyldihydronicotinamide dehydrogenase [quinone]-like isoform X1 [Motacilla alba alba]